MVGSVGSEVDALCGRCGVTTHIVLAKVGAQIARVECMRCHAHHRYRGTSAGDAREASSGSGGKPRSAGPRKPRAPEPVAFDPNLAPIDYNLRATYVVGQRVVHPSFGMGIVEQVVPGKIRVRFDDALRLLVTARSGHVAGGA